MIDFLDALGRRLGDASNADRFRVGGRLGFDAHARRVGLGLRDLCRVELGFALHAHRFLSLGFGLRD